MPSLSKTLIAAISIGIISTSAALSETSPLPQAPSVDPRPQSDGAYKGSLVCAQLPGQPEVFRIALDLTISGNTIMFARPMVRANQITGTEVANGTINGYNFALESSGIVLGTRYEGKYAGAIAADGGTFSGTQTWVSGDVSRTRTCTGAFVKAHT
jgi:hypothetical protein